MGKTATVCGVVVSPFYDGGPTFLNLDKAHPNQIFTILIWPEDRWRYPKAPEHLFEGKMTCVKGSIDTYQGVPQIVARENKAFRP